MSTISILIVIAVVCYLLSIASFLRGKYQVALYFLLGGSFIARIGMAASDPYLHNWDERFHALVAKNMIAEPLKPMLFRYPALPYDYTSWCCNHIWVHKQPLFLWQMAASMKLFGINEVALRLPSVLMGTAMVFFTQRIGRRLTNDQTIAYIAAFLFSLSWYQLELTSGAFALDHNDIAFSFYILGSMWAFSWYLKTNGVRWLIVVGLFVGGAILCKWLVGLLIYSGWGMSVIFDSAKRARLRSYLHIGLSILVALAVMLPWQIYILNRFPAEAAWEYAYNNRHLWETLEGHGHPWYFYFTLVPMHYGKYFIPFLVGGLVLVALKSKKNQLAAVLITCFLITYLFFSSVATKLQSFTFIVAPLAFIFISIGLFWLWEKVRRFRISHFLVLPVLIFLGVYCLKPWNIWRERGSDHIERKNEVYNTSVYRSLPDSIEGKKTVVINNRELRNIELMFYKNVTAYSGLPEAHLLDSLHQAGYRIYSFPGYEAEDLPSYIKERRYIRVLEKQLK